MLKLVKFINENLEWEKLLAEKPYCITIKRKNNFIIFNYNQIDSDFYNDIVKECRGIILEDTTFIPVCIPFYKFGNYGEGYADNIDWNTAKVQEKIDGSLIKVWHHNGWHISTNGTINASDAEIVSDLDLKFKTFNDLFNETLLKNNLQIEKLDPQYTYMFELVSPFNRVVVPYSDIDIYHIGTRSNINYQEIELDIGIKKPKTYSFNSLDEVINMAKELPFTNEGYVVVDNNWHRVKIKSPAYVAIHHLKNNGCINKERVLDLIKLNEHSEFLSYFPEYKEYFDNIELKYNNYLNDIEIDILYADKNKFETRKDYALWVKTTRNPSILFLLYDNKLNINNFREYINNLTSEKILKGMELQ